MAASLLFTADFTNWDRNETAEREFTALLDAEFYEKSEIFQFTAVSTKELAETPNAAISGNFTVSRFAHKIGRSPCAKRLTVKLSGSLPC